MAGGAAVLPPPRQLEVRRFAAARAGELRSLHDAVASRLDGRFQQLRSARRRTTGHLPSKKRRRLSRDDAKAREEADEDESRPAPRQSRRARRRRELAGDPAEGFSVAGDGSRRLRTHLWHAKRFSMARRWGFVLPVGAHGRGRGSRAVLKWLKNGTVVHDASYFTPIQLDGPEDSLLSILKIILRPSPADETPALEHRQDQVMRGVCYENATLWRVGSPPRIIGPVTYMWRPISKDSAKLEGEGDSSTFQTRLDEGSRSSLQHQLWIWIHPAALNEGLDVIRFACEKQMQDSGSLDCCSLQGKIARLEVMGCKAMQALKSMLNPVSNSSMINSSTDPSLDSSTGSYLSKASVIDSAKIILSMIVRDPRKVSVEGIDSPSKIVLNQENKLLAVGDIGPSSTEAPLEEGHILSSMWMHPGRHDLFLSDCSELWDSGHKVNPPMPEEIVCLEKHHKRIKLFCLDSGNDQDQATQEKDCFGQSCPVVLLKHAKEGLLSRGWSVILPLSWIKPFWLFLISHGAHAIGLRERRWIASKFKMPCFPYDFPDSKAYSSSFMAQDAADFDKAAEYRPAAMRPPRVPEPPFWDCIMTSLNKRDVIVRGLKEDLKRVLPRCLPVNSNPGDAEPSPKSVDASFQLLVPRTIQTLRQFVEEFDLKNLDSLSDMETDRDQPNLVSGTSVKMSASVNQLCLVRVLIRAFKEGSFEEGAVICAPFPSDLPAWKIRSVEDEEESVEKWELLLPQTNVSSYFSWLDPGTDDHEFPQDDTTLKALRWPIGFVTSGFVHGSSGKDAFAVAFCEAKLLALVRQQQWAHGGLQGQEICVLVRNVRSAAYRRALATIVVEQQQKTWTSCSECSAANSKEAN